MTPYRPRDSKCDHEPVQRALVTAKLFGIDGVPFLIAPDGRTFKGAPDNLADWLKNKPVPNTQVIQSPQTVENAQPGKVQPPAANEGAKP